MAFICNFAIRSNYVRIIRRFFTDNTSVLFFLQPYKTDSIKLAFHDADTDTDTDTDILVDILARMSVSVWCRRRGIPALSFAEDSADQTSKRPCST